MGYKDVNVVVGGYNHDGTHPQTYKTVILKAGIPLGDQFTDENTIYVVKWDFEIGMNKIYAPLDFSSGGTMVIDGVTYYWSILVSGKDDNTFNLCDNTVFFCDLHSDVLIPERSMTLNKDEAIRIASPLNTYHEKAYYTEANAVVIPENCVLKFEGGSFKNGTIIGKYIIDADIHTKIFDNVAVYAETIYTSWFGITSVLEGETAYNTRNAELLENAINSNMAPKVSVILDRYGYYDVEKPIVLTKPIEMYPLMKMTEHTTRFRYRRNDTFITLKSPANNIHDIMFEGVLETTTPRPTTPEDEPNNFIGSTMIDIQYYDNDSIIKDCLFWKVKTGIIMRGRQWTIRSCEFLTFGNGIVIDDIDGSGAQDGRSARNRIINCKFDHSNPASQIGISPGTYVNMDAWNDSLIEAYSCINNKNEYNNSLFITGCYNSSFNSLYRGSLNDSVISDNVCTLCFREVMWLNNVVNSVISHNSFLCNRNFIDGILYRGQNAGIRIDGDCIGSTFESNVIQGTRYSAIRMRNGEDEHRFEGNSIISNVFNDCGKAQRYIIYIGKRDNKSNTITGNTWTTNHDSIIYPDEAPQPDLYSFINITAKDNTYNVYEANAINNNFGDSFASTPILMPNASRLTVLDAVNNTRFVAPESIMHSTQLFINQNEHYKIAKINIANEKGFITLIVSNNYNNVENDSVSVMIIRLAGRNSTTVANITAEYVIQGVPSNIPFCKLYRDSTYLYLATAYAAGLSFGIIYNTTNRAVAITPELVDIDYTQLTPVTITNTIGPHFSKPTNLDSKRAGFSYFDTSNNKPLWWTGEAWVDATGTEV